MLITPEEMARQLAHAQAIEPVAVPLTVRVANFGRAVAEHIASGMHTASHDMVEIRLATCRGCDHYRASDGTCGGAAGCGCYVERKARWLDQACPLGRWPSADRGQKDEATQDQEDE